MVLEGVAPRKRRSPKRAAVLRAATEEFLSKGFGGTSMDRVAEAAQVSKRTVYDHFPSKEDLFEAIVKETLQKIDQMPVHEYSSERGIEEQLLEIGQTFAETITDSDFIKVSKVLVACFAQFPEWGRSTLTAYARLRRDMIAFFKAGKKDGRLRVRNAEGAATQFVGLIKEFAYWPAVIAHSAPLTSRERKAVVRDAVSLFLDHYGIDERRK